MGLLPAARVTIARLVLLRCPYPARVRLRLPWRLRVFTESTLTLKIFFSIAILICVLFESGVHHERVHVVLDQPVRLLRDDGGPG